MESATTTLPVPDQDLVPITANQRIEALDVVRGFALLGIFLMNIEWFNRPITSLGAGMPTGLTGLDWWASWFVLYFVQGKFWTIFSLLFGMGFAVMLTRAERAGREFKIVYLRRVLALAVFGAAHFILLWEGDILFSYAVGALMLMIVLYGKTIPILIGIAVAIGVAFIPHLGNVGAVAAGLALAGLLAIYLRSGKRVRRYSAVLVSAAPGRLACSPLRRRCSGCCQMDPSSRVCRSRSSGPCFSSRDGSRGNTTSLRKNAV